MKSVTIAIEYRDISLGVQTDPRICPLALATNRLLKPGLFVSVGADHIYLFDKNKVEDQLGEDTEKAIGVIELPGFMGIWITKYDQNRFSVQPIDFVTRISEEFLK